VRHQRRTRISIAELEETGEPAGIYTRVLIPQTLRTKHVEAIGAVFAGKIRRQQFPRLRPPPAHPHEAETCFQQALAVVCRQHAKSLELCAVLSLGRLWQQGRQDEACDVLAPICGWFIKGFDTAALREAAALLKTLSN
jgi:hypothetical protein